MFRSAGEYMQTCAFILKFYISKCIYLSIYFFLTFNCKNTCIDCRNKMNSIKSERLDGVYWKLWGKFSICLYLSFFVWRNLKIFLVYGRGARLCCDNIKNTNSYTYISTFWIFKKCLPPKNRPFFLHIQIHNNVNISTLKQTQTMNSIFEKQISLVNIHVVIKYRS